MPTRQYVGARYVPKFADPIEWNQAKAYEALTIVTYLNTSYTSKIPVPAGIPITNTKYWVNTGNYNAQVEQYRQEVEQVQADVDTLTGIVNAPKDCLLIGNSWVKGGDRGSEGVAGGWGNYFQALYKQGTVYSEARDGQGATRWEYQFDQHIAKGRGKYADVVICSGSINNRADPPAVLDPIKQFIDHVRVTLPKAKIFVISPDCSIDKETNDANKQVNFFMARALTEKAVPTLWLQDVILTRKSNFIGTYHISESLAKLVAGWVYSFINGGSTNFDIANSGTPLMWKISHTYYTEAPDSEAVTEGWNIGTLKEDYISARQGEVVPMMFRYVETGGPQAYFYPGYLIGNQWYFNAPQAGRMINYRVDLPLLSCTFP